MPLQTAIQTQRCWRRFTSLLFACLVVAPAARTHAADSLQQPGVVLFHKGDRALEWDHDELVQARTLRNANLSDVQGFLSSSSLAAYLGLGPVQAMHMPVPVNIVFIGFQADGNLHVNISAEQLQEWFGHLDHVLPHSRIELADLACAEDGHCAGLVHGTMRAQPVPSYVHLNFSCNIILTRKDSIASLFERAIHVFSRPVDPQLEMGAQQVDASRMEAFIDSFLTALGLTETGYSLVVLNPAWSVTEPVYGYRMGLSQAEIDILLDNQKKIKAIMNTHFLIEPGIPHVPPHPQNWLGRLQRSYQPKFGVLDASWSMDTWVASMQNYLGTLEEYRKGMLQVVGDVPGAAAIAYAVTVMRRPESPISHILHEELLFNDPFVSVYSKFRTMHPAEDCLVPNWVGHKRWTLVDLTAGGFDWGPAMGGEGVVHKHTLPSVVEHFSTATSIRSRHLADTATSEEKAILEELHHQTHTHKATQANQAYMAFAAELSTLRPTHSPDEDPPTPDQQREDREMAARKWKVRYQETLLKAELEMLEQYASRVCSSAANPSKACSHMKESAIKARGMLAKLSGAQATSVDVWKDLRWDVFGPDHDLEFESDELAYETQRARYLFLGELNGVLSRALRHVIAPPTATWTHAGGYLHDTATPFANKVVVEVYVIRSSVHWAADRLRNLPYFDLENYKKEIGRLMLSSQHLSFHVTEVVLEDDFVLATAFATALRSSAQEVPSDIDMVQEAERAWLDTRVLSHVLRQRFANARSPRFKPAGMSQQRYAVLEDWEEQAKVDAAGGQTPTSPPRQKEGFRNHEHYQFPLFVFELHRENAVLLDEHYNAKALEDMVIVVQNAARDDEHPTGMMCGGALLARPLSPLREALSATLTHLSGVLPSHLGYVPGRQRVQHDWLWSVGSHPHSHTSSGAIFTDFAKDAHARSYLLDAVDSSVDMVNEGVALLSTTRASKETLQYLLTHKAVLLELVSLWPDLIALWRAVMEASWHLNWGVAVTHLPGMEERSLRFYHLAQQLAAMPTKTHCAALLKKGTQPYVLPTLVLSCSLAVGAVGWLIWPLLFAMPKKHNKYHLKY